MNALNVANRTMFTRDNVEVLDNLNSNCVDLIYLDPPFNSNKHYAAPIGSAAEGAEFKDAWTLDDVDMAWLDVIKDDNPTLADLINLAGKFGNKGDKAYLIFMARRLLEMRRILKESGSIYLHCDPTMSHSLKLVMDCIFGKKNFRNEIVWNYISGGISKKYFAQKHDIIFFYCKNEKDYMFNVQKERHDKKFANIDPVKIMTDDKGQEYVWYIRPGTNDKVPDGVKSYLDKYVQDVWQIPIVNPQAKERKGYPTQKPLALLERILKASSNEGDMVLDPFCGCATTLVAAERLGRQWVGIDISAQAIKLIRERLQDEEHLWRQVKSGKHLITEKGMPVRTDILENLVNPPRFKATLYGWQGGICAGCGGHFRAGNMEVDHIQPKSKGGQNTKENLQLLCGHCNRIKGDRDMPYLLSQLKKKGIK